MSARTLIAIASGGAIGALVRAAALDDLIGQQTAVLLIINVAGSFLLGALAVRLIDTPTTLAGAGVGFCGALTSMSTFAVDVAERLGDGRHGSAGVLIVATAGFAVAGALFGMRLGESA